MGLRKGNLRLIWRLAGILMMCHYCHSVTNQHLKHISLIIAVLDGNLWELLNILSIKQYIDRHIGIGKYCPPKKSESVSDPEKTITVGLQFLLNEKRENERKKIAFFVDERKKTRDECSLNSGREDWGVVVRSERNTSGVVSGGWFLAPCSLAALCQRCQMFTHYPCQPPSFWSSLSFLSFFSLCCPPFVYILLRGSDECPLKGSLAPWTDWTVCQLQKKISEQQFREWKM